MKREIVKYIDSANNPRHKKADHLTFSQNIWWYNTHKKANEKTAKLQHRQAYQ